VSLKIVSVEWERLQDFALVRMGVRMIGFALRVRNKARREIVGRLSSVLDLPRRRSRWRTTLGSVPVKSKVPASMPQIFTEIFERNVWLGDESRSGQGSDMTQTEIVRSALPDLIRRFGIKTMLDVPCGDFNWMKTVDLDVDYIGGDIVPALIENNNRQYASPARCFRVLNVCRDELPAVDLLFCRDLLVHLSFDDARRALGNIRRSGSRYLLTTTFSDRHGNDEIQTGQWRPLNLRLAPFNLPEPLVIINERCTEWDGAWADKCLGFWRLADILLPANHGLVDE
jgi:hypothetical protein